MFCYITCQFFIYFRTYDSCEFFPGEKLNVILGPNGMILFLCFRFCDNHDIIIIVMILFHFDINIFLDTCL